MVFPVLIYGSQTWTLMIKKQKTSAEMKFLRGIKGCNLRGQIQKEDLRTDLKVYSVNGRIQEDVKKGIGIESMNNERIRNR